jgi:exodeoxyribonuclease-3
MRVVSWNVNGIRACVRKGFVDWLANTDADVIGLQETRARLEQLPSTLTAASDWRLHLSAAERPGYSGVGLLSRQQPDELECALGVPEFDREGRLQIARFGALTIANVYFPNGSGKNRDNSRIPFKLEFYRSLFERLEPLRASNAPVLVIGDFNTAHTEIDLARPKANRQTSGFCPEECAELDRWLTAGWVDTFRVYDQEPGRYTWWSNRRGARGRNVGWRIDYVMASPGVVPHLRAATIHAEVLGSDHCPIGVELDDAILSPNRQ